MTNQIISIILVYALIIYIIIRIIRKNNNLLIKNKITISKNVQGKKSLLTETEKQFYKMLQNICLKYKLQIFAQVALNQIIKANDKKAFNQIGAKTIDFVLTDKETNIKICIELDDHSHDKEIRQKRDTIVNTLCSNAGIKILRIPIDNAFIVDRIDKQIKESL